MRNGQTVARNIFNTHRVLLGMVALSLLQAAPVYAGSNTPGAQASTPGFAKRWLNRAMDVGTTSSTPASQPTQKPSTPGIATRIWNSMMDVGDSSSTPTTPQNSPTSTDEHTNANELTAADGTRLADGAESFQTGVSGVADGLYENFFKPIASAGTAVAKLAVNKGGKLAVWATEDTPETNVQAPSNPQTAVNSGKNTPSAQPTNPQKNQANKPNQPKDNAQKAGEFVHDAAIAGAKKVAPVIEDATKKLNTFANAALNGSNVDDNNSNAMKAGELLHHTGAAAFEQAKSVVEVTSNSLNGLLDSIKADPNAAPHLKVIADQIRSKKDTSNDPVTILQWLTALVRRTRNVVQDCDDLDELATMVADGQTISQGIDPKNETASVVSNLLAMRRQGMLMQYIPLPFKYIPLVGKFFPQGIDLTSLTGDMAEKRNEVLALCLRLETAQRDRNTLYKGLAQIYGAVAGAWIFNNSLAKAIGGTAKTIGGNRFTLPTLTAATITLLIRDLHHYLNVIKPTYTALTPIACPSPKIVGCDRFSISKLAVAKLEQLQNINEKREHDGPAVQEDLTRYVTNAIEEDIRFGRVVIRDRNSIDELTNPDAIPAIINVYEEGSAKALDKENIKFTLEREIAELSKAIAFLEENYNYNVDLGEDYYQAGWKFDYIRAKKAAKITPGTLFYELTREQFKTMDDFMKEKDQPLWATALRIPKLNIPCVIYPSRLPDIAQPSRWICSYAKPFASYQRAKSAWWGFVQQKEAAEAIYKLLLPPQQ